MEKLIRILLPGLLLLAAYYALFGGEYSVFELREARADLAETRAELERLQRENDSLRAWEDSLLTDSATIERLAREQFGMVRPGETLYRLVGDSTEGDTTRVPPGRRP